MTDKLNFNGLVKAFKEKDISQKELAPLLNLSESTVSNAKKGLNSKKISTTRLNEITAFLNDVIEKYHTREDILEYLKNGKNIEQDFPLPEGSYTIFWDSDNSLPADKVLTITKNPLEISLELGNVTYTSSDSNSDLFLNLLQGYFQVNLICKERQTWRHLLIRLSNGDNELFEGLIWFSEKHVPLCKKILIASSPKKEQLPYIEHFFRYKRLNEIKTAKSAFENFNDLIDFYKRQRGNGWETIYIDDDYERSGEKYKLYISTPITSVDWKTFRKYRYCISKLCRHLEETQKYQKNDIYYAGFTIQSEEEFQQRVSNKNYSNFWEEIGNTIRRSNTFMFFNLGNANEMWASSQLFQLGWFLSSNFKSKGFYIIKDKTKIPNLVLSKHVEIVEMKDPKSVAKWIQHAQHDIFKEENSSEPNY